MGGSSRRMVTGRGAMARKISLKSLRWIGSSLAKGRFAILGGLGHDHVDDDRQPVGGVEHALGAAQADAHGAVADGARGGFRGVRVGAHLEACAISSAQPSSLRSSGVNSGSTLGTSPRNTWPVLPSMVTTSPSLMTWSPTKACRCNHVDQDALGAGHAGLAHAARHHRRVRGLAAAAGENALREKKPWMSSGLVSSRTRMTFTPCRARVSARSASNTIWPDAAPGEAPMPCGERHDLVRGVEAWKQHLLQQLRVDAQQGLLAGDQPFIGHFDRAAHHRPEHSSCRCASAGSRGCRARW
jgi:hypothetical protein